MAAHLRIVLLIVLCWLVALPASAATSAVASHTSITADETLSLTIETDQSRAQPDLSALAQDFVILRSDSGRQFNFNNGRVSFSQRFRIELRPRRSGQIVIAPITVGNEQTAPITITVSGTAPAAPIETGDDRGPVFVETELSDASAYVQQTLGLTLRLYYARTLFSGELRQPAPEGASLTPFGSDSRAMRVVNGRQYRVVERRYLLVPERSGVLQLPAAEFQGEGEGSGWGGLLGDSRETFRARSQPRQITVKPIPDGAAMPWLPARQLRMRINQAPGRMRVGQASDIVVELQGDGLMGAQLPALEMQADGSAQIFTEPAKPVEDFIDGQPRATFSQRFSVVPGKEGTLVLNMQPLDWWQTGSDSAQQARLAPIRVEVQAGLPGQAAPASTVASQPQAAAVDRQAGVSASRIGVGVWLAAAALLLGAGLAAWGWRRRRMARDQTPTPENASAVPDAAPAPTLAQLRRAIDAGELAEVARLIPAMAQPPATDLAAARLRLDNATQRAALDQLQASLWGDADAEAARVALGIAFSHGPDWRLVARPGKPLLPPLYPE